MKAGRSARRHSDPGGGKKGEVADAPRVLVQALGTHGLFAAVPGDVLSALAGRMSALRYRRGYAVLEEGAPGTSMFVVLSGAVHVRLRAVDDAPVATIGRGGFFGEIGALYGLARTASVTVASDEATLASLSRADALGVLAEHPRVFAEVLRAAQTRYYATGVRSAANRSAAAVPDVLLDGGRAGAILDNSVPLGDGRETIGDLRAVFPKLFRRIGDGALARIAASGLKTAPPGTIVAFSHEPSVVLVLRGALSLFLAVGQAPRRSFGPGAAASLAAHHPLTAFLAAECDAAVLKLPSALYSRLEAAALACDLGQSPECVKSGGFDDKIATPSKTRCAHRESPDYADARPMVEGIHSGWDEGANPSFGVSVPARGLREGALNVTRAVSPPAVPIYVTGDAEAADVCAVFSAADVLCPGADVAPTLTGPALLDAHDAWAKKGGRLRRIELVGCVRLDADAIIALLKRLGRGAGSVAGVRLASMPGVTDAVLQAVAARMPFVEHLEVASCRNVTSAGLASLGRLSDSLASLSVRRMASLDEGALSGVVEASSDCAFSRLKELDLSGCAFLTTRALAMLLKRTPRLRTLRLSCCDGLDERLARALAALPPGAPLSRLDVSHCGRVLADAPLAALLRAAPPTLREIDVSGARGLTRRVEPLLAKLETVSGWTPAAYPPRTPAPSPSPSVSVSLY